MLDANVAQIIVGAVGVLIGQRFIDRLFFVPSRVRDESAMTVSKSGVESTVAEDRGPGRPGRVHGLGGADHGRDPWSDAGCQRVGADTTRAAEALKLDPNMPARDAYMPAVEHIDRFIVWALTPPPGHHLTRVRLRHDKMAELYADWAMFENVVALPVKTFQTLMKRHPQVLSKRDPIKNPVTGGYVRKASGAPERETYYTISPPRAAPAMPGKPPVADVVPQRPTLTKSQREKLKAESAAATRQPSATEQPLPGAGAQWASEAPRERIAA